MIAIALAFVLTLASIAVVIVATSPLFRTFSRLIDSWADEVHGLER